MVEKPLRAIFGPFPRTIAFAVGIIESLQIFGYILGVSPIIFQAMSIALKLLLFVLSRNSFKSLEKAVPFLLVSVGLETFSFLFSPYQIWSGLAQLSAFGLSIALTISLLKNTKDVVQYAQGFAQSLTAISVLYLFYAATGRIDTHFGRYAYFGESHPNLGAEIGAMAVITACMSFRLPALALRIPVFVGPVLLMQGRAGILACLAALLVRGFFEFKYLYRKRSDIVFICSCIVIPLLLLLASGKLYSVYETVFRINDDQRGDGTGLVGRNELWVNAWNFFQENPFIGRGPTAYQYFDLLGPHNFYMWGFSTIGMMFLFTLIVIYRNLSRAFRSEFDLTAIACTGVVMTFFNDRLFALSPYPFIIFVMICTLGANDETSNYNRFNPLRANFR